MKKIKFAIVGFGNIGKRHFDMINLNPDSEVLGICDLKSKKEIGIEKINIPFFQNIDDLLNSKIDFDVINICTPNGFHKEHTLKSLDKNHHIVCEKPMSLSKLEAEEMIYKSLQVSKKIFVVMQNRYSSPSVWAKNLINSKILGEIFLVQINCFWNRDDRYYLPREWRGTKNLDGGTLFTQFAHFIDIMYWLFGDIKNIYGKFKNFSHKNIIDFEDSGIVNFEFINGGICNLNYSTSVFEKNLESSLTVIAENGSFKIGGQYMNKVEFCNIKNYKMPKLSKVKKANDYGKYKGSASNHQFVIQNVIDTLKGKTQITTNALEGLKVVEIIERIYNS